MKSAQISKYGGSEVVEINQNTSSPNNPSLGKVLVTIKAAGVNPSDWKFREGFFQQIMPLQFPSTLGWDFSGVIEKVGEGVSKLKHIIKENVKAALSDNKKLISISFVAIIQTIKADPQTVKLIQNMPSE